MTNFRDNVDPCPKGDPDCETGDDGSCHDGCVAADRSLDGLHGGEVWPQDATSGPVMCDDPERRYEHEFGSDGSCHTCAMALDEYFNLRPDAVEALRARARRLA